MTNEELTVHIGVLEVRLTKLAAALILLLDAIDEGNHQKVAAEIRQLIEVDMEEWE